MANVAPEGRLRRHVRAMWARDYRPGEIAEALQVSRRHVLSVMADQELQPHPHRRAAEPEAADDFADIEREDREAARVLREAMDLHLADLIAAHGRPPEDVAVPVSDCVPLVIPVELRSKTSPAQLCADWA